MAKNRVLIVDDNFEITFILKIALTNADIDVLVANSGEECLKICAEEQIDLILLDMLMPWMDGIAVCQALKQDKKTARIPVVFLTAFSDGEERTKAMDAGARAVVEKPVDINTLCTTIREVLGGSRIEGAWTTSRKRTG